MTETNEDFWTGRAISFAVPEANLVPVLVNGNVGVVATVDDEPVSVMGFTIVNSKVVAIDVLADPERPRGLDLSAVRG